MGWAQRTLVAAVLMGCVQSATAADLDQLAGDWSVTWDKDSKNSNKLALRVVGSRLTGTYANDKAQSCPVSGDYLPRGRSITLFVRCPDWNIYMRGKVAENATGIGGTYEAYGDSQGTFEIAR